MLLYGIAYIPSTFLTLPFTPLSLYLRDARLPACLPACLPAQKLEDFWFVSSSVRVRWLVMSSSKALKDEVKRVYGDKVRTHALT